ncbi:MAG: hypothetical protein GTO63_16160 [Anaerolineae bacterium]|nr:hypothetical protein [Anaerolineae bacterium]NIN96350.1 hypothetical protein [Anaerolineae bacterium]NIQ79385.1 hypothetical protein [Anaerolineae bacterium]
MNESSEQQPLFGLFRAIAKLFRKHPAIGLTLVYAQVSSMGVMYMWGLFRAFGINIMEFAEPGDFLLSGLKQPVVLTIALVGGASAYVLLLLDRAAPREWPRQLFPRAPGVIRRLLNVLLSHRIVTLLCILGYIFYFWLTPLEVGSFISTDRVRRGVGPRVVVELTNAGDPTTPSKLEGQMFLIGTTSKFAFFYGREHEQTHIIPIANILRISGVPTDSVEVCATPTSNPTQIPR